MEKWTFNPARDANLNRRDRMRSINRESGLTTSLLRLAWWPVVRAYLRVGHRLKIEGRENLPTEPPFVVTANHSSHLDAIVLASAIQLRLMDAVLPIAAGDTFFETPAIATFATAFLNAIPMWRRHCGPHAMQDLRQRLQAQPCIYILFPEGTRSRTGTMSRFRSGVGMLVAETDVPVIPCHLAGAFDALPPDRSWPRFCPITLRIGSPRTYGHATNQRGGWDEIAQDLSDAVTALGARQG